MTKKRIDLFLKRDEILGQKMIICLIKCIKKICLYLTNILYMVVCPVHMVRMIIRLIDILW